MGLSAPQPGGHGPDELALRIRYKAGDQDAFERLWRRHVDRFQAQAIKQCFRNREDAEDALQETAAKLQESRVRAAYDPSQPWGPWVGQILYHNIIDLHRRRGGLIPMDPDDIPPPTAPNNPPEGFLKDDLHDCLRHLPVDQLRLIILVYYWEMSQHEAALLLGHLDAWACKLLKKARKSLRDCMSLKGYGDGSDEH